MRDIPQQDSRSFGSLLTIFLSLVSIFSLVKAHPALAVTFFRSAVLIYTITLIRPGLIAIVQGPWERAADIVNSIITAAILFIVYFVFITPYILLLRLCGVRFLKRYTKDTASVWEDRGPLNISREGLARYERQF